MDRDILGVADLQQEVDGDRGRQQVVESGHIVPLVRFCDGECIEDLALIRVGGEDADLLDVVQPQTAWRAATTIPNQENLTSWSIQQHLIILMDGARPLQVLPADK